MNYTLVMRYLGMVLGVLALGLLAVALLELPHWLGAAQSEHLGVLAMLASAGLGGVLAGAFYLLGRGSNPDLFGRREAMLVVALSWVLGTLLGAMPFFLWYHLGGAALIPDHPFRSLVDCWFESVSGLTTTGATILYDIDRLPRSILLWRSMTQWLGALGIIVLFVAVLPVVGTGSRQMYRAESAGPQQEGVRPRIKEMARTLWLIYLGLTIMLLMALYLAGMNGFDALCHTFSTISTGGFSPHNASIGTYASPTIDMIVILFMIIGALNFGIFYLLVRGRYRQALADPQMRWYLIFLGVSTVVIALLIMGTTFQTTTGDAVTPGFLTALRYAGFNMISLSTSTGFGTADYDQWPYFSKAIMMVGMFINGCTGSTASGMKVLRLIILVGIIAVELERAFRPSVVRTVRVGNVVIDPQQRQSVLLYILLMTLVIVAGAIVIRQLEPADIDLVSTASAVIACFANTGPGLGLVGPTEGYGLLTAPSKVILSILMLLGRLEIYALVVLFVPAFWRRD